MTKNYIYLNISTSTGKLHQKNEKCVYDCFFSKSATYSAKNQMKKINVFILLMKTSSGSQNVKVHKTF